MLKAMKEQLKHLSEDADGAFHLNLRSRVGKRATSLLESRLKRGIVLIPDLVERIYVYWQAEKTPSKTKRLGSYLLTYLYLPKDFLSEKQWSFFGYLDDAYFVAKMYTTVISDVKNAGGKVRPSDLALCDQLKMLKKDIRIVIPKECDQIDRMILELIDDKKDVFLDLFNAQ